MPDITPGEPMRGLARFLRDVVDSLNDTLGEAAQDPASRRALEADVGLPAGSLDGATPPQRVQSLDTLIDSEDADLVQFVEAMDDIVRYGNAWARLLDTAAQGDTSLVVDELVYRVFEVATLNRWKYHHPAVYWWGRLLGFVVQEMRLVEVVESLRFSSLVEFLKSAGGTSLAELSANLRLDRTLPRAEDPCPGAPGEPPEQPGEPGDVVALHTDPEYTAWSDLAIPVIALAHLFPRHVTAIYGWESSPGTPTPIADQISARALTLAFTLTDDEPEGGGEDDEARLRAVLTSLLFPDGDGAGLFLALRGGLTVEREVGDPPWKLTASMNAPDGGELLINDGDVTVFGDPSLAFKVKLERAPGAGPAAVVPSLRDATRLELGQVAVELEISAQRVGLSAVAGDSALVIGGGDGILDALLRSGELRLRFDLGLGFDNQRGLHLVGGTGLSATLPIALSAGPVELQTVQVSVAPATSAGRSEVMARALATGSISFGPVRFSVDQIGFALGLGFADAGAGVPDGGVTLLPSLYLSSASGFHPPNGIGVLIDAGVTGGGFLFHDAADDRYAGVLQLRFETFSLTAVAILGKGPPGSDIPVSLLCVVSAEGFSWVLPMGIRLTAIGGMIGLNHTADVEAMRAGLKANALDAVLFPENPVRDAGRIVSTLGALFPPAADQFLVGLTGRFEWPTPTLFTVDLALVIEFGAPTRLLALGQFRARLPRPELAPVRVNIDAIGVLDFDRDSLAADATLYDSRLLEWALTGDAALRITGGDDPVILLALGGFHPRFSPPPDIPTLERLAVHLSAGDNLRMRAEAYVAVTSNTFQFGAHLDAHVGFAGFSIDGNLGLDVLFQSDAPEVVALIHAGVAFRWRGVTLLGVQLEMTMSGFAPLHFEGKATFEIGWFSVSKSFDKTFLEDRPSPPLPQVDALSRLVDALAEPGNWTTRLPTGQLPLVTLGEAPAAPGVVPVHPLGELGVRQRVIPLGIEIARIGQARPVGARQFTIDQVTIDGRAVDDARPLTDLFAPAQFIEMSDQDKLSRPSFEQMDAGVLLPSAQLAYGGEHEATLMATTALDYETFVLDGNGRRVDEPRRQPVAADVSLAFASSGASAHAPLTTAGRARFRAPGLSIRVVPPSFAVVAEPSVDDGEAPGGLGPFPSYTAAEQARRRLPSSARNASHVHAKVGTRS